MVSMASILSSLSDIHNTVYKAKLIHSIDGKCDIKFKQSPSTPLLIMALGVDTHTDTHTNTVDKSNFEKPGTHLV